MNCKSSDSQTNNRKTSSSQRVTQFYTLRSKPIQSSSSPCRRSTSNSTSPLLRYNAKSQPRAPANFPSPLLDIPLSLRPSFGFENSFAVHSCPKSTHLIKDQELLSTLSATNTSELPFYSIDKNSRHPTPNADHYPLILHNQIIKHLRKALRYNNRPVNGLNKSLQ